MFRHCIGVYKILTKLTECKKSVLNGFVKTMSTTDITQFFPQIQGNLTLVTWAHAVNNQSYLKSVLADDNVMMIEADISIGKITNSDAEIPIMTHPPAKTSDLSLEDFLKQVDESNLNANNTEKTVKGVKLDFKSIEAFIASVTYIENASKKNFPLWINADILSGPGRAVIKPVNSTQFLSIAKIHFPDIVLSLGWTTMNVSGGYTNDNVKAIIEVINLNKITNIITFPVRASLTAHSSQQMKMLLEEFRNSTLTIWSSPGDTVDIEGLRNVIFDIGVDRIFVDVPDDLKEKLHLDKPVNSRTTLTKEVQC